jgi:hypothetical protein
VVVVDCAVEVGAVVDGSEPGGVVEVSADCGVQAAVDTTKKRAR